MLDARLKTGIWVQAQIRICDRAFLPIVVEHRGDSDSGAVLLRLTRRSTGTLLLRRSTLEGAPSWMVVGGTGPVTDDVADAYVAREVKRDRDLWVVTIEDPREHYVLDGPVKS